MRAIVTRLVSESADCSSIMKSTHEQRQSLRLYLAINPIYTNIKWYITYTFTFDSVGDFRLLIFECVDLAIAIGKPVSGSVAGEVVDCAKKQNR